MKMVRPEEQYMDEYLAACREAIDRDVAGWQPVEADRFDSWRENAMRIFAALESGEGLPPDIPRMITRWRIAEGMFTGEVQLRPFLSVNQARSIGHIGYAVRPSMWGRGIGSELLRYAVSELRGMGVRDIYVVCDAANTASARVAIKAGFRLTEQRCCDGKSELLYVI